MPGQVPGIFLFVRWALPIWHINLTLPHVAGINRLSLFCRTFPYEL